VNSSAEKDDTTYNLLSGQVDSILKTTLRKELSDFDVVDKDLTL
jgi:hypothetical protein